MIKKNADNDVIIRSKTELQLLAELLKQNFSFNHKTIADARKTVNTGIYTYTFDAATLLPYESNVNCKEARVLDDLLYPFYQKMDINDHEVYKELRERRVLLWFLLCAPKQYRECEIEKQIRPDFILTGEKRIGIEITELITSFDRKLFSLTRQIREKGLHTQEEIEEHIHRYHKSIEDKVILNVEDNVPLLCTGASILTAKRIHFAEEIKRKYEKYKRHSTAI